MEDQSNVSSPDPGPYTTEDDTLPSIGQIPTIELEPTTDTVDLTDHGATTDFEGTTQIDIYADGELEKGRPSQDDAFNYDGHDVSVSGKRFLTAPSLAPLEQERTSTSLRGSVQEFFEGHEQGKQAMDYELGLTLTYTICHFLPAVFWALVMAALCIVDGYQSNLVTGLLSYQPFARYYGEILLAPDWMELQGLPPAEGYDDPRFLKIQIPLRWQLLTNLLPAFGVLVGLVLAAWAVNSFGYRHCAITSLVVVCCFLSIPVVTTAPLGIPRVGLRAIFLAGEFCLGFPCGFLAGFVGSYISDITPLRLRVFAATMINVCYLCGAMLSVISIQAFGTLTMQYVDLKKPPSHDAFPSSFETNDIWALRGPMLMQFIWIVRKGNDAEALRSLRRLNQDSDYSPETALDAIKTVNEREKKNSKNAGIIECFYKANVRRTEIAAMVMITQQLVGQQIVNYGVKLLQTAGVEQSLSLWFSFAIFVAYAASNLTSIWIMKRFGRRKAWLWGLGGIIVCLIFILVFSFFGSEPGEGSTSGPLSWGLSAASVAFAFIFNLTLAPVSFTIVGETPSSRLKTATNGAGRGSFMALNMLNGIMLQYFLTSPPQGLGIGPRVSVLWTCTASVCWAWAWFRLPEMKNRTPAEIDILFEKKVPARH